MQCFYGLFSVVNGLYRLHAQHPSKPYNSPRANTIAAFRYLDLSGNRVTSLAPLAMLPALHTLLLSGNCISSLVDCAPDALSCLETLDVSFNGLQLDSLPQLGQLPQLRQLDVSGADILAYPAT